MIEEVIKEINEAEVKAQEIIKEANIKDKEMIIEAEAKAAEQRKYSVKSTKQDIKATEQAASKKAELEREKVLQKGREEAASLIKEKEKDVDKMANEVLSLLIEKY